MLSKKIRKDVTKITFPADAEVENSLRTQWAIQALKRISFVKDLKARGLKGKEYSNAVVEYDRGYANQSLFNV